MLEFTKIEVFGKNLLVLIQIEDFILTSFQDILALGISCAMLFFNNFFPYLLLKFGKNARLIFTLLSLLDLVVKDSPRNRAITLLATLGHEVLYALLHLELKLSDFLLL